MKFLISYVSFDTTVNNCFLGDSLTLSILRHDIISTTTPAYDDCNSIREIEAAFEGLHNYKDSDDQLSFPQAKIKVLKIEPLPVELPG